MAKKNIKTPQITVPAQPYIELPTDLTGELVAQTIGYDHAWYGLFACKNLDYRETAPSGASFAKINPSEAQNYRILAYSASWMLSRFDAESGGHELPLHSDFTRW